MPAVLSKRWWEQHKPHGWSRTGIGGYLDTYNVNDAIVTESGIRTDDPRGNDLPAHVSKAAHKAKSALSQALESLDTWSHKKPPGPSEREDLNRLRNELKKGLSQYKWIR